MRKTLRFCGTSAPGSLRGDVGGDPLRLMRLEAKKAQAAGKIAACILSERVDDSRADALALTRTPIEPQLNAFPSTQRLRGLNARATDGELVDDDRLIVPVWQFELGGFGQGNARPAPGIPFRLSS